MVAHRHVEEEIAASASPWQLLCRSRQAIRQERHEPLELWPRPQNKSLPRETIAADARELEHGDMSLSASTIQAKRGRSEADGTDDQKEIPRPRHAPIFSKAGMGGQAGDAH